jgi:hypothetical protein
VRARVCLCVCACVRASRCACVHMSAPSESSKGPHRDGARPHALAMQASAHGGHRAKLHRAHMPMQAPDSEIRTPLAPGGQLAVSPTGRLLTGKRALSGNANCQWDATASKLRVLLPAWGLKCICTFSGRTAAGHHQ